MDKEILYKFTRWYNQYNNEITWFLVGFLFYAGLDDMYHHNYISASIDFGLVLLNLKCYKDRIQ
jgi:hypothetical protein